MLKCLEAVGNEIVKSKGEKSPLYKLLPINPSNG